MSTNRTYNEKYGVWVIDNGDGTVDVEGDINIANKGLTSLKDLIKEIGIIRNLNGSFDCSDNNLKNLEGSPVEVTGDFRCIGTGLITLKGSPKSTRDFNCSHNNLINLEYGPIEVNRNYLCFSNKLITLRGGPLKVSQWFNCSFNNLTNLDGAPKGVIVFRCVKNPNLFFTQYELDQIKAKEYEYDPEQLINDDTIRDHMPF